MKILERLKNYFIPSNEITTTDEPKDEAYNVEIDCEYDTNLFYVYVIKERVGRKPLYFGHTNNPNKRRQQHFSGTTNTCTWIKKYHYGELEMQVLYKNKTLNEALLIEDELMIKYKTLDGLHNKHLNHRRF